MVESARGVANATALLTASERVVGVSLGVEDLCADLGVPPLADAAARAALVEDARRRLVFAAAVAGVAVRVDGPSMALDDVAGLEAEAARLRGGGWSGRMCVHPRQVAPTLAGFRPSAAEVAWAEAVLAAPEGGAVRVGGTMVDAPVRAQARRVLEEVRLAAANGGDHSDGVLRVRRVWELRVEVAQATCRSKVTVPVPRHVGGCLWQGLARAARAWFVDRRECYPSGPRSPHRCTVRGQAALSKRRAARTR